MRKYFYVLAIPLLSAVTARATETENFGLRILPAPAKVVVDGKFDDWDLSGGIFACGDVETAASNYAVWVHGMYDQENLYILARWMDPTPMNHAGSIKGDYGFNGDCLQIRIVTAPDVTAADVTNNDPRAKEGPQMRTSHITAWRDRDKLDVINFEYGRHFDEGGIKDAKTVGAAQAFLEWPNKKGYTQEIAIPWKLLAKPGVEMKTGSRILMTLEPNFTVGTGGRLTIKDLFKPGVALDRVFTFQGNGGWGFGTLEPKGNVPLAPVRLSDAREFPVRMDNGIPAVDWTGLTKSKLPDGFKPLKITVPEDGYVSLNVFGPDGTVARQLLTSHYLTKGDHDIKWDGLTTTSVRRPGNPVVAGDYTYEAIHHTGIGLRLRGWADNSGGAPWRGWGADHGNPVAVAAAGDQVFAGWAAGEGDKPLQASNLKGEIQWKNIRGGIAGAGPIACDGTTVYAFNGIGQYAARAIYRVDAKTGGYTEWSALKSTDLTLKDLLSDPKEYEAPSGLAAAGGKVFVSFSDRNIVFVIDAKTGSVVKKLTLTKPGSLAATSGDKFLVLSSAEVLSVNADSGDAKPLFKVELEDKQWPSALTVDKAGNVYVGVRGTNHQVFAYGLDGKFIRAIGRKGGRALTGPWTQDGMLNVSAIAVDADGKLWVAEDDGSPKRVSVWDTQTGTFKAEFFGSSSYGAIGSVINPQDPYLMVGQGCEWRIDPKTGKSSCVGVITRDGMGGSRFGFGQNGKLYLAITSGFLSGNTPVRIYERLGDAQYKLRAEVREAGKGKKSVEVWSDANDDGKEQPDEVKSYDIDLQGWIAGWYMPMTPDLTFYGSMYQVKVTGWTACGAPQYDLTQAKKLPGPADAKIRGGMGAQHGHGSADGKFMLWNGGYGEDHSTVDCFDIASGKRVWSYPTNFTGVHGSHRAVGPEVGMIRGAYDITGSATLSAPVGNIWVIPTNKGEWHVLTEKGFYLTRLFEGDPMKNAWPEQAVPGASLDTCPPGAGEEAFGGSITQGVDGKLSVQAGHVSYWNAEVVGLDTVHALTGGKVTMTDADVATAKSWREKLLHDATSVKRLVVEKITPTLAGDLEKDFAGGQIIKYQKEEGTACKTAIAYDGKNLYLGFDVKDSTPWINGADAPEFLYARGDTCDLQIGTDPKSPAGRTEAVLGDMRISIGSYQNQPTVVVYRRVATEKNPKLFNSGVVKGYEMESVIVMKDAKVQVKVDAVNKRYVMEATLPLSALGFTPTSGMVIRGDVGVTHGNKDGKRTVLRTHWSNQNTGLVSDEVFELQMFPATWGEIQFK